MKRFLKPNNTNYKIILQFI